MRRFKVWHGAVLLAALALAGPAPAEETCRLEPAALAALPTSLAGGWQGKMLHGIAVQAGMPAALPEDPASHDGQFDAATEGALVFSDATTQRPIVLAPVTGADWDFALPGESPLSAAELLEAELAGVDCPLGKMPQFRGKEPLSALLDVVFHVFVLSPDQLLMVMQVRPTAETGKDGLRVVLRYSR